MMDPYICLPTNMGDPHDSYAVVPAVMHCLYLFNIAILLQTLQHTHSHSHGPEMSKKSIYTKGIVWTNLNLMRYLKIYVYCVYA